MKKILLSALCALCAIAASAATPRYIFYFIGDGMGMGHVMATQAFNRYALGATDPLLMMQFPVMSAAMTYSFNSPVTDSAAAGTALATGVKTRNNMVGMAPDTTAVTSVAAKLRAMGYGVGIITSNSPDDATPASFYAHVDNRSKYYDIDCQAAVADIDFLGGANLRGVTDKEGKPTDLMERLSINNWRVLYGTDSISLISDRKVLMLSDNRSADNSLGYALDSIAGMTIPQLTQACLTHLERVAPDKFFMMVEHGIIDWAAHSNDAASVVAEVNRLQEAVRVAYNFYLAHPDETLIIITADHDTAGLALGNDNPDIKYFAHPEYWASQHISKEGFSKEIKAMLRDRRQYTWDDIRQLLTSRFGFWETVPVTEQQTQALHNAFEQSFGRANTISDQETLYASFNNFAVEVLRVLDANAGAGWISTYHTGQLVPVFAIGAGAQQFSRMTNNIDIPARILDLVEGR